MNNKYVIEVDEMSAIIWSLEGVYKRLAKDRTKDGKKVYKQSKTLHDKLLKEFMSR